jgi:hypothetical protein
VSLCVPEPLVGAKKKGSKAGAKHPSATPKKAKEDGLPEPSADK